MRIQDHIINPLLLEQFLKAKDPKIEVDESHIYITVGIYHRAKYPKEIFMSIYEYYKEIDPKRATRMLAKVLGGKDE